jgi:hypothetical protein
MIRAPKILLTTDKTIWTKAFNNCNKSTIRTGVNHVWIRWYPGSTRSGYFRMGLAKDGGPGGGGKSEKILDASTFKDNIKIVVVEGEPKIQITYNRDDKPCTVTLEPCDETKRKEYKNCLTPGIGFESKKEWVESVMLWFNNKIMEQESKNKKSTTPPIAITDEQVEKIIQEQQDQDKQSLANSKKIENTELSALTQNINELSSKTNEEMEKHLDEAQKQMDEHDKLMTRQYEIINKTLGITPENEEKTGGKKSRKKRRTKKRKSIRRKKAKKTKKH